MMYLGFMDSHKCISLVGDFEDEGGHADVKIKKKIPIITSICCEPKIVLKIIH